MVSKLETLPDELLLMVYHYLYPYHVLLAFLQLNNRFERTLLKYKQDLRVSTMHYADVQRLYKDILPVLYDHVTSLTLDNKYTHGMQGELFLLPIYSNLCFLHIQYYHQQELIDRIAHLVYMPKLKTLKIDSVEKFSGLYMEDREEQEEKNIQLFKKILFGIGSIENVYLPGNICDIQSRYLEGRINRVERLYLHDITLFDLFFSVIPFSENLHSLSADIYQDYMFREEHFRMLPYLPLKHLTELYLHCDCYDGSISFSLLSEILLRTAPNILTCLSLNLVVEIEDEWIDGEKWRKLLSQLPKLIKLNLFITKGIRVGDEDHYNLNIILNSFATDWWVKEKQWFITVIQAVLSRRNTTLFIHSNPLEQHDIVKLPLSSIKHMLSTRPDLLSADDQYVAIENLKCQSLDGLWAFPNLKYLTLSEKSSTFPTTSNTIPYLKYLTHITIDKINISNIDKLFSQLRLGARHIHSLAIQDQSVFKYFLQQTPWKNIHDINLWIKISDYTNFIQRLAHVVPNLHFLCLGIIKYDDFQLILCDTLEYCQHLIGFKVQFSSMDINEENYTRHALIQNLDEWLLNYTNLTMDTFKASFDHDNDDFILWL